MNNLTLAIILVFVGMVIAGIDIWVELIINAIKRHQFRKDVDKAIGKGGDGETKEN